MTKFKVTIRKLAKDNDIEFEIIRKNVRLFMRMLGYTDSQIYEMIHIKNESRVPKGSINKLRFGR